MDLVGRKFDRLSVLERTMKEGKCGVYWLCQCDCNGENSLKKVRQDGLMKGSTRSCGCLNYENITTRRNNNTYEYFDDYIIIHTYDKHGIHSAYVDKEDFDLVKAYTWSINNLGYARTAIRRDGVTKQILLHRLILGLVNAPKNIYTDHIDGNPSNNRKYNLRIATNQQNQYNAKVSTINSSGHRGVTWRRDTQKWRATLNINKENTYLGEYATKKEAIKVRQDAEQKHYGDYSALNREKVIAENKLKTETNT